MVIGADVLALLPLLFLLFFRPFFDAPAKLRSRGETLPPTVAAAAVSVADGKTFSEAFVDTFGVEDLVVVAVAVALAGAGRVFSFCVEEVGGGETVLVVTDAVTGGVK